MQLQFTSLTENSKDRDYFEQINIEAFPRYERWDMKDIFAFAKQTDTEVLGVYDGETPIGFSVLVKHTECAYIYYLAIDKRQRSKGYGSATLHKLMEVYSDLQLILDFEDPMEESDNCEQRIRRKEFYLRNGLHETGHYTLLNGGRFEVVCNKGELLTEAFEELIHILHEHREEFPDVLL